MKKINFTKWVRYTGILMLLVAFSATLTSCVVHHKTHRSERRNLPPGQAKKYYGERSAKRYAPGQQKKQHKKSKHNKGNKRGR